MIYKGIENIGSSHGVEALRFSKFCHYFERKRIGVYYHSLTMKMVFLSKEDAQELQRCGWESVKKNDLILKMKEHKLIVPVQYDESQELRAICDTHNIPPDIRVMYLMLTEHCNYDCSYCFIRQSLPPGYKSSFMSCRTVKKSIDRFSECLAKSRSNKEKTIIFYGGEPLLNVTALKSALRYIKLLQENGGLPRSLKLCLNTNGSLITGGIAEYLKKHDVHVAVSIDGKACAHDVYRVYPDGRGTFEETIKGFYFLKKAGLDVTISCTAGPHNMKEMENIADWFINDLGIEAFGWNILADTPGKKLMSKKNIQTFTAAALRCYEFCLEHGIYEDAIGRIVTSFVKNQVRPYNCAACGEQMVVSPDGKIGICHAFLGTGTYFDHHVDHPFTPESDAAFIEWKRRSPLNIEDCHQCAALGICGGGCPYEGYKDGGTIWNRDQNHCIHARAVLEWLIWKIYRLSRKRGEPTPPTA